MIKRKTQLIFMLCWLGNAACMNAQLLSNVWNKMITIDPLGAFVVGDKIALIGVNETNVTTLNVFLPMASAWQISSPNTASRRLFY